MAKINNYKNNKQQLMNNLQEEITEINKIVYKKKDKVNIKKKYKYRL